jgi:membrane dipeptidase
VTTTSPDPALLAARALSATPLIDGHNDLVTALRVRAAYSVDRLDQVRPEFDTDLVRLRAGRVGAQFWAAYVPGTLSEAEAVKTALEQIDAISRLIRRYPETLRAAWSADDIVRAFRDGRIASLIGIEGGGAIGSSLGVIGIYRELGVRYVTLTHNHNTEWADAAADVSAVGGLSASGHAILREFNRHGILADLSHTAASTQHAALDVSAAPVIFSHSCCRGVVDHPRNVDDDVLTRLRSNGGVLQVAFAPIFVSAAFSEWASRRSKVAQRLGLPGLYDEWPPALAPGARQPPLPPAIAAHPAMLAWLDGHPAPRVTVDDVVAHIEHARDVAGIEHIGIGGDYDGAPEQPTGLEDVSCYPRLFEALAARGWREPHLRALAGENMLRVLRDADRLASRED